MRVMRRVACMGLALGTSLPALAHDPFTSIGQEQAASILGAALLGGLWLLYLRGARRHSPGWGRALCFHAALGMCVLALFGPLDTLAETSAAAHMSQHMLLMMVIPPLWVFSRPLPQLAAAGARTGALLRNLLLHPVRDPLLAACVHGAVVWFWHMPYFYVLALENPWWHLVEHACFLLSAGLFWWAVFRSTSRQAPWALLAVLLTLMHTGFLGALLTFARAPLYGPGRSLADQQLAGLIMWVAGALPYLMAAGWIGHRWYRQLLRRMREPGPVR